MDRKDNDHRRPYAKPEITRVLLKADEAVLGNCKVAGVNGPGQPGDTCSLVAACSTLGS